MDVVVETLIVDEHRVEHISRHNVTTDEVREVVTGDYVFIQGHHGRWLLIGKTKAGRFLTVVVGERAQQQIPTAWLPADQPAGRNGACIGNWRLSEETRSMTKIEKRKKAVEPIPPFETIEEEAQFWDTHDAVDTIDKGTLVGFHHSRKTDTLTIRFEPDDIQRIREQALQLGIDPTTLAHMWILERLRAAESRPQPLSPIGVGLCKCPAEGGEIVYAGTNEN